MDVALNLKTSAQKCIETFRKLADPEKKEKLIKANFDATFKVPKKNNFDQPHTLNSFKINSLSLQTLDFKLLAMEHKLLISLT